MTQTSDLLIREDFSGLIRHPSVVLITGGRGAGKSVLAHRIAVWMHGRGCETAFLCPRSLKEKAVLPDWMQLINYRYPKIPPGKVVIFDDAQLRSHAREWMKRKNIQFDKLISLSRHRKSTLLLSTQETYRLDRNVVGSVDVWLHKKPSLLGSRMERREVKDMTKIASEAFKDLEREGLNPLKYAYCIHDTYLGFVGPYDEPSYWCEEISEW